MGQASTAEPLWWHVILYCEELLDKPLQCVLLTPTCHPPLSFSPSPLDSFLSI